MMRYKVSSKDVARRGARELVVQGLNHDLVLDGAPTPSEVRRLAHTHFSLEAGIAVWLRAADVARALGEMWRTGEVPSECQLLTLVRR